MSWEGVNLCGADRPSALVLLKFVKVQELVKTSLLDDIVMYRLPAQLFDASPGGGRSDRRPASAP